jgi:peroxin-6
MQRTAVIEASAERGGYFSETVNCRFKTNQSLVDRISAITARNSTIIVLNYFDSFDDVLVPSVLSGLKCLVVSEDYESAVKKVPSPFTFQYFFELSEVSDRQPLSEAYSCIVNRCPLLDANACMHQLDQRLSNLGVQEEQSSPNVAWEDIGGLETAKQELRDLMSSGLRRGILLYGPPGTGKTLLAKAIATEASKSNGKTTFISVKGPELLSMYIGESEKNVRSIFEKARSCRPAVIFFDELDSLAPARGRASDSANVMDRVVASLLTELDNLPSDVIVVAATNRPDLLDSSLARPGRIDRQVYVGIPEDKSEILNSLARKFNLDNKLVAEVLPHVPRAMTGSDLAGVLRKAYLVCAKRVAETLKNLSTESGIELKRIQAGMKLNEEQSNSACRDHCWKPFESIERCDACSSMKMMGGKIVTRHDLRVNVSVEDLVSALQSTAPSVSESELRTYEELRDRRATVIG